MLIIIAVIMLFTVCKDPSTEQNVYEENFDGITFGMTKEEVISVLGRDPDSEHDSENKDGYSMFYDRQIFFDITAHYVYYSFDGNGHLDFITAHYTYYDESEKEQMPIDLDHIKEELSKYYPEYPEKTRTYTHENEEELSLHTENRRISLSIYDHSFSVMITIRDESE